MLSSIPFKKTSREDNIDIAQFDIYLSTNSLNLAIRFISFTLVALVLYTSTLLAVHYPSSPYQQYTVGYT